MLRFYYHPSPNPAKVALFLEESGLPYEVVPVDTRDEAAFRRAHLPHAVSMPLETIESRLAELHIGAETAAAGQAGTGGGESSKPASLRLK